MNSLAIGEPYCPFRSGRGTVQHDWLKRDKISRGAREVYGCLVRRVGKNKVTWCGQQKLASDALVSVRQHRRYLKELVEHRLIRVTRRGLNKTNLIELLAHEWMQEEEGTPDRTKVAGPDGPFSSPQEGSLSSALEGSVSAAPYRGRESGEGNQKESIQGSAALTQEFELPLPHMEEGNLRDVGESTTLKEITQEDTSPDMEEGNTREVSKSATPPYTKEGTSRGVGKGTTLGYSGGNVVKLDTTVGERMKSAAKTEAGSAAKTAQEAQRQAAKRSARAEAKAEAGVPHAGPGRWEAVRRLHSRWKEEMQLEYPTVPVGGWFVWMKGRQVPGREAMQVGNLLDRYPEQALVVAIPYLIKNWVTISTTLFKRVDGAPTVGTFSRWAEKIVQDAHLVGVEVKKRYVESDFG